MNLHQLCRPRVQDYNKWRTSYLLTTVVFTATTDSSTHRIESSDAFHVVLGFSLPNSLFSYNILILFPLPYYQTKDPVEEKYLTLTK